MGHDLTKIWLDPELLEAARLAVEDELVDLRDRCMWIGMDRNGFTINNKDGSHSDIRRFGTRYGIALAMQTYFAPMIERMRVMAEEFDAEAEQPNDELRLYLEGKAWGLRHAARMLEGTDAS